MSPSAAPPRQARKPELVEVSSPKIYVGNLSFDATESDLYELFNGVGKVQNAEIVSNKYTQKSKGFAFVTMLTVDEARRAVTELHDKEFMGRKLVVSGAKTSDRDAAPPPGAARGKRPHRPVNASGKEIKGPPGNWRAFFYSRLKPLKAGDDLPGIANLRIGIRNHRAFGAHFPRPSGDWRSRASHPIQSSHQSPHPARLSPCSSS